MSIKNQIRIYIYSALFILSFSCINSPKEYEIIKILPPIFPDYNNIIIPQNIAPLNFYLADYCELVEAKFKTNNNYNISCTGTHSIEIPLKKWKRLLAEAIKGDSIIEVEIAKKLQNKWIKYESTRLFVKEEIDSYITYRLIEPGYVNWGFIGIYQRNLENFEETPIFTNNLAETNCINCHTFNNYKSDNFLLHVRGNLAGTLLYHDNILRKLDTKTNKTISTFTYPSWHPSGNYIAFSTNQTLQFFHSKPDKQIEVFDEDSDIVLYDIKNNKVIIDTFLAKKNWFETYPSWSPDGKNLYFCTTEKVSMPFQYKDIKYSICKISFDQEKGSFNSKVDTIYKGEGSAVFPRVSPNGKYLLFNTMDYGCFPIWHKESELCMLHLETGEEISGEANSNNADSYHVWSSNGKWVMFCTRRIDGFFTRLFFSYVDENGKMHKPFSLPQAKTEINTPLLKSYNTPDFIESPVSISPYQLEKIVKGNSIQVNTQ